jgi:predicted dehydrogenase
LQHNEEVSMSRLRLGVIGVGHLGKEHARILSGLPDVELVGVADVNRETAHGVAERCGTRAFSDYRPLLGGIDAAVLAVPTVHHHAVARDILGAGVALLVEKPLASTPEQAEELVGMARVHGALLQVGHIERFNPAFEELQRLPLRPRVVNCQRLSAFTGRSTDIGAVLDLMIHDIDLILALVQSPVATVHAVGVTLLGGHEDVTSAQVVFANGCVANLTASRVNPTPLRRMQVWGPEGHALVDFARRTLTLVQAADVGCRPGPGSVPLRKPEAGCPFLDVRELDCNQGDQLTRELQEFVHCLRSGTQPRCGGEEGRDALVLAGRILHGIAANADPQAQQGRPGTLFLPVPANAAA